MTQHSIERLRDGLQRLINSHFNQQPMARTRIPAQRDDDDLMLSAALDELERLRSIVADIAKTPPTYSGNGGDEYCNYCLFDEYPDDDETKARKGHQATCPYILACNEMGEQP